MKTESDPGLAFLSGGLNADGEPAAPTNAPSLSVGELSRNIKRTLEGDFGHVRVRGEVSGAKRAASGHWYFRLKDEKAVIDSVCWRGSAGRLSTLPEDGLEVIATGRVTTYEGRSVYQLIVEQLEPAGAGALLKLLEDRRKKLAAEGLFDEDRKHALPYLPGRIGVVTSPTGAVIRDILHRLADRFPRHVLVAPVRVQGEGSAEEIAAAIQGMNALEGDLRPDVLIVARGGGSLEDLWAFNEEIVVRAAAASAIPLISAVGHETDTTLIDYASDRRAPTPTAAAEMAVPVRQDLVGETRRLGLRLAEAAERGVAQRQDRLMGIARGLPQPARLVETAAQRLDDWGERLALSLRTGLERRQNMVARLNAALPSPMRQLEAKQDGLRQRAGALDRAAAKALRDHAHALDRLDPARRLVKASQQGLQNAETHLAAAASLLESYSYENTLERGFVLVRAGDAVIANAEAATPGLSVELQFAKGQRRAATIGSDDVKPTSPPKQSKRTAAKKKPRPSDDSQGSLL
jgi:exodeoxyribonuclease VII large subunit